MSSDWIGSLKQALASGRESARVAVVGVGHELRGDDAAGVMVARALMPLLAGRDHVLVVDGGPAPENYTGLLRRFAPALVLLVDTAQMNEPPGAIRWLAWQATTGLSASTHTMPPYMMARYLNIELGCEVALLGIQPARTTIGATLSPPLQKAVDEVVKGLVQVL